MSMANISKGELAGKVAVHPPYEGEGFYSLDKVDIGEQNRQHPATFRASRTYSRLNYGFSVDLHAQLTRENAKRFSSGVTGGPLSGVKRKESG